MYGTVQLSGRRTSRDHEACSRTRQLLLERKDQSCLEARDDSRAAVRHTRPAVGNEHSHSASPNVRLSDGGTQGTTNKTRDSLTEITHLLKQKAPETREVMERTKSLRRSYPSVRVTNSLYNHENERSVFAATESIFASSELEFDFDDAVVNSAAYRRAFAAAKYRAPATPSAAVDGDLIDFSDHDTLHQAVVGDAVPESLTLSEDLIGLLFSEAVRMIIS